MNTALVKSTVATGTGFFASIATLFYGYANFAMLAFFGIFLLTLAIQYNALKIKVVIPFVAGLSFVYFFFESVGLNFTDLLSALGLKF